MKKFCKIFVIFLILLMCTQNMVCALEKDGFTTSNDIADETTKGINIWNIVTNTWDIITSAKDLISEFKQNPFGTIISIVSDFFCEVGDDIQWIANLIQMNEDNEVLYSYDYLKDENSDVDNVNKYTNVGEYKGGEKVIEGIDIKKDENKNGKYDFSKKTKIPVPIGDLYNLAVGHIDFFNVNFFSGKNDTKQDGTLKNEEGSKWTVLRDVAATLIRICIYAAGTILIIFLILTGVGIVKSSIDDPEKNAENKKSLEKFATAVAMLIGSVIIMALCIFGTRSLCGMIGKDDSYEYPIRINVEDTYSFSTTITGYFRYMSLTYDVDEWLKKIACTMAYLVLTVINLAGVILMFVVMLALWGLAMVGPITAVMSIFNGQHFMSFGSWARAYLTISAVQILMVIGYKILLSIVIII